MSSPATDVVTDVDVIVVGAGISGIYTLHRLRSEGLTVRVLEAGSGVGGTWYWNRYPGCRFDLESYSYGYFFPEIIAEWSWSEEYAAQPETERYLNFVVDRLGLRDGFQFDSRVKSMTFDEATATWVTVTEAGESFRSRYVVTAVGILSAPIYPRVPGIEDFAGESYHTALWPSEKVELAGKRVAVVGTGSSGIQVVQTIAPEVASMVVFQRTPNWATPLNNRPISPEKAEELRRTADQLHQDIMTSPGGTQYRARTDRAVDASEELRRQVFEELYAGSGMSMVFANFNDVARTPEGNALINEFLASKIRERVKDPQVAERLIPTDHGFTQKRPPLEIDYYEVYNQDNVTLVSTGEEPMLRVTEKGIETPQGVYEVDVIIWATGFDSITGSFTRMDITGSGGQKLTEHWEGGPRTFLGIETSGFPNFFMVGGPQSTTGNIPRYAELQANWIARCIRYMRENGYTRAVSSAEAEDKWSEFAYSTIQGTLQESANSWAWGTNVPGKKRVYLIYGGGLPRYQAELEAVASSDFKGVEFSA